MRPLCRAGVVDPVNQRGIGARVIVTRPGPTAQRDFRGVRYRRIGAREPLDISSMCDAHISHSSAQPRGQLGKETCWPTDQETARRRAWFIDRCHMGPDLHMCA
jgi:hypothetical protein